MYVKPCPVCGRNPRIEEGCRRANGQRFYTIYCPNFHNVLRPGKYDPDFEKSMYSTYYGREWKRYCLHFTGDYDYNQMYKKWNEELINE